MNEIESFVERNTSTKHAFDLTICLYVIYMFINVSIVRQIR